MSQANQVEDATMSTFEEPDYDYLQDMAHHLRIDSIKSTCASNSGHPTSCSSMAEIISVLFFHTMRLKVSFPRDPASDRFILSKGHAAPILYAAWAELGLFPKNDLLNLRKIDSDLEGHPTPRLNFIDVGTGSLGQGLSIACGMAYVGKFYDMASYRVYCVVGDGESAEGSIWEACHFANHYRLDNLCCVFDINRLGQSEATSLQHDMEVYRKRLDAFGFNAIVVDGHDVAELAKAFFDASITRNKPTAILAKTFKGKYFLDIEDSAKWHGKPLGDKAGDVICHLESLMKNKGAIHPVAKGVEYDVPTPDISGNLRLSSPPNYTPRQMVATRFAYGTAIAKMANGNRRVIALDADTKNSTFAERVKDRTPDRFIECFIAEQNLVGVAIGATCRDRTVAFVSTFATFFTRAFDQIRMGAISQTNVNFVGSHCGVSIGEDGPSQMALEDIAMFRAIPGSTVFYPSDAITTEMAVELAANTKGVCYIRTSRPDTPVIHSTAEQYKIGLAKVVKKSKVDKVLVIGAGITLYEALEAYEKLAAENIHIRVLDPFTIKPIDAETIIANAKECGGNIITVEDHYPEGGLGEAVMSAVAGERGIIVKKLAVNALPRSGPSKVLIDMFGISSRCVINAVREIIRN